MRYDTVVQWLRARFNDGYDKADFARGKCGEIPESAQHVDKLIFDKALEIVRVYSLLIFSPRCFASLSRSIIGIHLGMTLTQQFLFLFPFPMSHFPFPFSRPHRPPHPQARAAALDELENNREDLGWDPDNCLLAYETALSMLHAVLDTGDEAEAGSGSGLGLNLEDQQTIDKCELMSASANERVNERASGPAGERRFGEQDRSG